MSPVETVESCLCKNVLSCSTVGGVVNWLIKDTCTDYQSKTSCRGIFKRTGSKHFAHNTPAVNLVLLNGFIDDSCIQLVKITGRYSKIFFSIQCFLNKYAGIDLFLQLFEITDRYGMALPVIIYILLNIYPALYFGLLTRRNNFQVR